MREILFRGQAANRKDGRLYRTAYRNGDWVFGLLTNPQNSDGFAEMTNEDGVTDIEVASDTVGQFTGFTDKTDKKMIFEGDVVELYNDSWLGMRGVVVFARGAYCIKVCDLTLSLYAFRKCCEVIGNIHDNPKLMEDRT